MNAIDIIGNSVTGGALGIFGGIATGLLGLFQTRESNKFEILKMQENQKTMTLQAQLDAAQTAGEITKTREKGAADAFTASIQAEANLGGAYQWVQSFRVITRPALTWWFVVQMGVICWLPEATVNWTEIQNLAGQTAIQTANALVFWWFGQRQVDRMQASWGNARAGAAVTPQFPTKNQPVKEPT